jgi:hypothetical protein
MQQLGPNGRTVLPDDPVFFVDRAEGAQVSRRSGGWLGPGAVGARASTLLLACIGVALALSVVALSAAGPAPSFTSRATYPTGSPPYSVAIGDLNGDSSPDLVTADYGVPSAVSVFLNRGDGSFQVKRDYLTGNQPISVAISDLNGDGKLDVATANNRALTISVLLNRGDGSFEPKRDYRTGTRPLSVAIGDLSGDGKPEVVTANAYLAAKQNRNPGTVSVFVNKGDGSFQAKLDYRTGKFPRSVALDDLNGDGQLDLATANLDDHTVSVLINRGHGSLEPKRDYRTGDGPRSVAIGDLNGDGKPDLATTNSGDRTVTPLLNKGNGSFRIGRSYRAGTDSYSVAIGDLNGDSKPDLVTANSSERTVSVFDSRGGGRFEEKLDYRTGNGPFSVAIGDLNRDGGPDMVTADFGGDTISVLTNRPGLCTVQFVVGMRLAAAKRATVRANCRVGTIRRAYSQFGARGRVVAQRPRFGAVLPKGGKVNLVVSRGPRR